MISKMENEFGGSQICFRKLKVWVKMLLKSIDFKKILIISIMWKMLIIICGNNILCFSLPAEPSVKLIDSKSRQVIKITKSGDKIPGVL